MRHRLLATGRYPRCAPVASLVAISVALPGLADPAAPAKAPVPKAALHTSVTHVGQAHHQDGGKLAYKVRVTERHRGPKQLSSRAVMRAPGGAVLMHRKCTWRGASRHFPDHKIEHPALGRSSSVRKVAGGYRLERQQAPGEPVEHKVLKMPAPAVNGCGMALFLADHLAELSAGQTVRFSMAAPSRLDWYRFRARSVASRKLAGRGVVTVRIEPDSMLVRAFAGAMRFHMESSTGAMLGYDGMVAVRDSDGDRLKCKVRFTP